MAASQIHQELPSRWVKLVGKQTNCRNGETFGSKQRKTPIKWKAWIKLFNPLVDAGVFCSCSCTLHRPSPPTLLDLKPIQQRELSVLKKKKRKMYIYTYIYIYMRFKHLFPLILGLGLYEFNR